MSSPSIHRLAELHELLLQFQAVERHVCYADKNIERAENDAEHSYSLTITAWFLSRHFPELDQNTVISISLAHDLVEVHAGDTSVFADNKTLAGKAERESQALSQLADEWADFPELIEAMRTYKQRESEEAKFVYALDKLMPVILNYVHKGYSWRKHGITLAQLHDTKKEKLKAHPAIHDYYLRLYKLLRQNPHFFAPDKPDLPSQQM